MALLPTARAPEGLRLYAMGDIHGEIGMLDAMLAQIDADLEARPAADWRTIFLGDYIDRGPDAAGVIERLATLPERFRGLCLRGNHDDWMLEFLSDRWTPALQDWLKWGGTETLASWGVDAPALFAEAGDRFRIALHRALDAALPSHQRAFMEALRHHALFGDFGFVHAGIRPGEPWEAQTKEDLLWIRDAFLDSEAEHSHVVVHGHTPTEDVVFRPNRIGLDTGAGKGGPLTAIVIEGSTVRPLATVPPRDDA